ncbi:MAG: hypothetical protein AAF961_02060 [Planctomycetota bacterium]
MAATDTTLLADPAIRPLAPLELRYIPPEASIVLVSAAAAAAYGSGLGHDADRSVPGGRVSAAGADPLEVDQLVVATTPPGQGPGSTRSI